MKYLRFYCIIILVVSRFLTLFCACAILFPGTLWASQNRYSSCAELSQCAEGTIPFRNEFCVTGHVTQVITLPPIEISLADTSGAITIKGYILPSVTRGDTVVASGLISKNQKPMFKEVRRIGPGPVAEPVSVSAQEMMSGRYDWRLIRLRGRLQSVQPSELTPDWLFISFLCNGMPILAAAPRSPELVNTLKGLIDASLDVAGICTPNDGSRRTKIGRILHYPGLDAIRVVAPPPEDPFKAPDIRQTYSLSPFIISSLDRHVAHGRLLAQWDDDKALIQLEDQSVIKVTFAEKSTFNADDFVEVLGLPESDLHHINLINAIARPGRAFPCPERPILDGRRLFSSQNSSMRSVADLHGHTIRLTGTIRSLPSTLGPSRIFYLDVGKDLVAINASMIPDLLTKLQVGMKISLMGICIMSIENWRPRLAFPQIDGFFIVPRKPNDVQILAAPPWWTPNRLALLITALLAVIAAILAWNAALRRLSTRKGRELLREQLGHVKSKLKTEERTRLAVELHDSLAQNLTGVSLELDTAVKIADEDPISMKKHLGTAARSLKSCRDELRNCLWDLRNRALEAQTMEEAIRQTLAPHVANIKVTIRFHVPRERISDSTAHAILRIIRELTLNAIRHGQSTQIRIAGRVDSGQLLFSVQDNGCGFDPDEAPGFAAGHYGLMGIQERVDEFEGEFKIRSSPGKGTKATITLNVPQEEEHDQNRKL